MAETQRKALVIHSPHSGRSSRLAETFDLLRDAGINVVEALPISELDGQPPQGSQWQKSGIDVVIAAGGDGLIGGVISHIATCGMPLGILPLGTANDIARSLLIPLNLESAAQVIGSGHMQEVDVGVAKPSEQAPHLASKGSLSPVLSRVTASQHSYFAHALTIGMNVQFARIATNVATRKRYGRLTYPIAALEALRYYDALDVSLHMEGVAFPPGHVDASSQELLSLSYKALQITIINAPIFGGQWKLSVPGASINDRLLDIVVLEQIELGKLNASLTRFFNSLSLNRSSQSIETGTPHHPAELSGIPGIHHFQARGVIISTSGDPRDATLDGEVRGQTPVYVHMADERLRVMVPHDL